VDYWTSDGRRENGCWPSGGQLSLEGFIYGTFSGYEQASVRQRLAWIRSQYWLSETGWQGFSTQPYEQLAAVYREGGQEAQARKVAIARRTDLRKYGDLNSYQKLGNWILDKTIKFGYQAWRAGAALVVLFLACWTLAIIAQRLHVIVPVNDLVVGANPVPVATQCTSSYPCFFPAGYAVDIVIPIVNVHQADYWGPDGGAPWGWAWVAATWAGTGLGWALATLLVAGYTGLVRSPD
jgi:hypothetical protein